MHCTATSKLIGKYSEPCSECMHILAANRLYTSDMRPSCVLTSKDTEWSNCACVCVLICVLHVCPVLFVCNMQKCSCKYIYSARIFFQNNVQDVIVVAE